MVAVFILVYVRPFEAKPAFSIAAAWNESIGRLGISPVYPPQEDMQVGDLLAAVVGAETTNMLKKSTLLAHIDMRDLMLKEQQDRLLFADTVVAKEGDSIPLSNRLAVAAPSGNRVALTLAAFPGFAIRYSNDASASASTSSLSLFGARKEEETEEIRIPVAETYGVSPASAVQRLKDWCGEHDYGVQPHVELMLITRVYLMREIDQRRTSNSNRNLGATASFDVAGRTDTSGASPEHVARAAQNEAAESGIPARTAATRITSNEIALHRSFHRPLVFGYRYVSLLPK
jgi:hypothetical protein